MAPWVRLARPGYRPCGSTLRLPPDGGSDAVAFHRSEQALGAGPHLALPYPQEQVPAARPIEPEHDLLERGWKQGAKLPDRLPHSHQLRDGDVAPDEIEQLVRPIVAMQPYAPPSGAHVQRQLGAVVVGLCRGRDGWIRDIALTKTTECIADK
jgi:hypothetical protein